MGVMKLRSFDGEPMVMLCYDDGDGDEVRLLKKRKEDEGDDNGEWKKERK